MFGNLNAALGAQNNFRPSSGMAPPAASVGTPNNSGSMLANMRGALGAMGGATQVSPAQMGWGGFGGAINPAMQRPMEQAAAPNAMRPPMANMNPALQRLQQMGAPHNMDPNMWQSILQHLHTTGFGGGQGGAPVARNFMPQPAQQPPMAQAQPMPGAFMTRGAAGGFGNLGGWAAA